MLEGDRPLALLPPTADLDLGPGQQVGDDGLGVDPSLQQVDRNVDGAATVAAMHGVQVKGQVRVEINGLNSV